MKKNPFGAVSASLLLVFLSVAVLTGCNAEEIQAAKAACNIGDPSELAQAGEEAAKPVPSPTPGAPDAVPASVKIDPGFLREQMFRGNGSVLIAINRAHQARDQVNIARGNLLPSINLGAMILSGGNPAFALSSVDTLLPFLIPSRWFDYRRSKNLLLAENEALRLAKLNTFASMYSVYYTVLNDVELQRTLADDTADLEQIADFVYRWYQAGAASEAEYRLAKGQAEMARINLSKMNDLVAKEMASLRHAMGLSTQTQLNLVPSQLQESTWEAMPLDKAVEGALEKSPERQQLKFLVQAAINDVWSKTFGFFTGASLRAAAAPGGHLDGEGLSFSNMTGGASFSIGFATIPAIQLSQHNLEQMRIRERELPLEMTETLEVAMAQLSEAKSRRVLATNAEGDFRKVFEKEMEEYQAGGTTLRTVLEAKRQLRQASIESLRAYTAETLLRVTFHRTFLSDQFGIIEGCKLPK